MRPLVWRVIALTAVAAGGSSTACSESSAPPFVKIDDLEGTRGSVEWPAPAGLAQGGWFAATDCSELDRIWPPPNEPGQQNWSPATVDPYPTFPGVTSTQAARLQTLSPLTGIWGAVMGFSLAVPASDPGAPSTAPDAAVAAACPSADPRNYPVVPVDVSAYRGITFWAKAGPGARVVRVELADTNTDPRGDRCNDGSDDTNCYNYFYVPLLLTDTMTRYTVDFSQLQQEPTWGYRPTPGVPDLQHVYQIQFEVDAPRCAMAPDVTCADGDTSLSFDLWVDDIYFVNR